MSETMMWINKVLQPLVVTAPEGIIPLLFLDSYGVHTMVINDLSVEVIIIPPGCTGLTQPIDVGYNKPFKNHMRKCYK